MDYSYFRTEVSKRRRPATTRELNKMVYSMPKNFISLAEGMPNEKTFPFTEITIKLYDGTSFTLNGKELAHALQYMPTQGFPPLLQALREFQRRAHAPPLWESRDIIVVTGAQDGLSKILEAVIGAGDAILVPDLFYPGVKVVVTPHQAEFITIPQDDDGPIPELLREILWNRKLSGEKMPKIMYINPTGSNPVGIIVPLERRKEIYSIACEYNFLIVDDDPYHFVHYDKEEPRSFLSLDTEGRVIRLDSFSKVISSGMRVAFVTAAAPLIAIVEVHLQSSHLQTSSLSQVIMYKLLEMWGYDGLMAHYMKLRCFYKERRDLIVTLARKHLNDLVDFNLPKGGFFLWMKVRGIENTWQMIMQRGVTKGIIIIPGGAFTKDTTKPCNAIRASFARISYEEMDLAMERLAQLIRAELTENGTIENVDTR